MLIGIDGNEANVEKRVGVSTYGFEILWNLYKLQDKWKDKHKIIVYLKRPPLNDLPKANSYFSYKVITGEGQWIARKLTPHLLFTKDKPDVFFSPSHYVPLFASMPRVCSIMDLGYLEFSEHFKKSQLWQLRLWSAYSIFVSKAIIAISNSTKDDILRHYSFASGKTHVTYLAYDHTKFNTDIKDEDVRRIRQKYTIVGDYILFLSTLKPSKNIEGLLTAFSLIKDKFPSLKLVIAGKKGWLYESIFKKASQLGLEGKVIFTDYIPEEDKPGLIAGARAFVLPSFWEGFGLDPLNAMACGVPVVVSDKGSLPEVVGEAGVKIDPYKPESIANGISKVLSLSSLEYNRLKEKCLEQAGKFSWEKTALKTLEILESTKK